MRNEISLCLESVTILKYGYILQFIALNDTFVVCALFYNIVISKNITCLLSFQNVFALVNSLVSAITSYTAFLQYVCHDNLCNSSFLVFTLTWATMFKVCALYTEMDFLVWRKLNKSLYSLLLNKMTETAFQAGNILYSSMKLVIVSKMKIRLDF